MVDAPRPQSVTVTSRRLRLTVAPMGRVSDVEFTALAGAGHRDLADELWRDYRVGQGVEGAGPDVVVESVEGGASGLFDPTPHVPVPQLPAHPTESDLATYSQQLAEASRRQWQIGLAQGRALLAEGMGASGVVSVRATGGGVLLEVTFRPGVAEADPQVLRQDFFAAIAQARAAAGSR